MKRSGEIIKTGDGVWAEEYVRPGQPVGGRWQDFINRYKGPFTAGMAATMVALGALGLAGCDTTGPGVTREQPGVPDAGVGQTGDSTGGDVADTPDNPPAQDDTGHGSGPPPGYEGSEDGMPDPNSCISAIEKNLAVTGVKYVDTYEIPNTSGKPDVRYLYTSNDVAYPYISVPIIDGVARTDIMRSPDTDPRNPL
jgi:hypothetical protein